MKKLKLILFFAIFFISVTYAQHIVLGPSSVKGGYTYQYSVNEIQKYHTWKVTNGTLSANSYNSSYVDVTWSKNAFSGTIECEGRNINNDKITLYLTVSISNPEIEPRIENMAINTSGNARTGKTLNLSLSYNLVNCNSFQSEVVTWTINNAGWTQTFSGKNITYIPTRPGSTTITAHISGDPKVALRPRIENTITKTITVEDGRYDPPAQLVSITGAPAMPVGVGSQLNFVAQAASPENNQYIEYIWKVNGSQVGSKYSTMSYGFMSAGTYSISCQAKNSLTGQTSNTVYTSARIESGYGNLSLPIGNEFSVEKASNKFIVSKQASAIGLGAQSISYQIYNMYTGLAMDKGIVDDGGNIDTSALPKGIYIITLNDGEKTESHKFIVK